MSEVLCDKVLHRHAIHQNTLPNNQDIEKNRIVTECGMYKEAALFNGKSSKMGNRKGKDCDNREQHESYQDNRNKPDTGQKPT